MIGVLAINEFWDGIENAILKGEQKAEFIKKYPLEFVKRQLLERNWQCWTTGTALFLTCITVYPSGHKVFEVLLVTGTGMRNWNKEAWGVIKAYADERGCDEINFMGRKGWLKYGLKHEPYLKPEYRYRVTL